MAEKPGQRSSQQTAKPSFGMRLIAAVWFTIAFSILTVAYFRFLSGENWNFQEALRSPGSLYLIVLPTVMTSVCALFLGGSILSRTGQYSIFIAVLRGAVLGLIGFALVICAMALGGTLAGTREFIRFVGLVAYLGLFLGRYGVIAFGCYGAGAGFLLYWIGRSLARSRAPN